MLLAKEQGLIDSLRFWVDRLRAAGLHIGEDLLQKTLEMAGEKE